LRADVVADRQCQVEQGVGLEGAGDRRGVEPEAPLTGPVDRPGGAVMAAPSSVSLFELTMDR